MNQIDFLELIRSIVASDLMFVLESLCRHHSTSLVCYSLIRLAITPLKYCSKICLYHTVVLREDELEEKFVKGWGRGGQKVNKTSNCVELKHVPTGIAVKCHQTRSLVRNRCLARSILKDKLDLFYNGKESAAAKEQERKQKRKADYARKRRIRDQILNRDGGDNFFIK